MDKGFVYIIYSEKWNQFYIGSTQNVMARLDEHNDGRNRSTRGGAPWVVKYTESLQNPTLARK